MKRVGILGCLIGLMVAGPVAAQESPKLETVLAEHRKALGGSKVNSLRLEGTYAYNGLEYPIVELRARPDLLRREIDGIQQYGTQRAEGKVTIRAHGPDGSWVTGEKGPEAMPDTRGPSFAVDAVFGSILAAEPKDGTAIELLGRADLEGVDTFHLTVSTADGHREEWWLDASTYLPIRRAMAGNDDFLAPHTWHYDDWRSVDGAKVPFYVMAEERVFSREFLYKKAQTNVDVGPELFSLKQ